MVRRFPILIALILLCASCNTFARLVDDSDTDTNDDMDVADTNPVDLNNVSNNLNNMGDMSDPDLDMPGDVDMPGDMADSGDVGDMPDLPVVPPYMWDGEPDAPLMLNTVSCTAPSSHPALASENWIRGNLAEDIDFVSTSNTQPAAQLGWIDGQDAMMAPVAPGDRDVGMIVALPDPSMDLPTTDMLLGPRDDPNSFYWITTTGYCTNEALATIQDDINSLSIGCPTTQLPINVVAMEAAGGFNPYFGAPSMGHTAVWQEVVGQPTPKLVASGNGFGVESGISTEWLNPRLSGNFSIGTSGPLAFFPDADGVLHSWNITNASFAMTPGGLPFQTDLIDVRRGMIDIVKIDGRRYVVAQVVGSAIELTAYEHPDDGSSTFTRIGRWYAITDLQNPTSVELATFQGGFVLWYEQVDVPDDHPRGPQGWWVHPFEVGGDTLRAFECDYVHRYSPLTTRDNDLLAWRNGTDLVVLGAVNFRFNNTQYINVEGPTFTGLFQ